MLSHHQQHVLLQPESPGHVEKGWDRTQGIPSLVTDNVLPGQGTKRDGWVSVDAGVEGSGKGVESISARERGLLEVGLQMT